jgi:hypothetical protein
MPIASVEPRFLGEELRVSNDDHPFSDMRTARPAGPRVDSAVSGSTCRQKAKRRLPDTDRAPPLTEDTDHGHHRRRRRRYLNL